MPPLIHELSDVDVAAISIVGKGANRKRFFLRRSGDEPATEPLLTGPAPHDLIFKGDAGEPWSAVYCVVAEPGWLEDAGLHGDQSIADRWASEDEIRKAAHRFAKNGGLVTKLHESLAPYGALVENAVALDTFTVDGPDGAQTILKGSWYIAIEPTDEGRAAIDAGEFNGVSIEGVGVRRLVEKAQRPVRGNVGGVDGNDGIIRRALAKLLGDDPLAAELAATEVAKGRPTFAERMAQRDFEDELPDAFDVLRSAIWSAFYPDPGEDNPAPAGELIAQSLDEFKAWAGDLLESQGIAKVAEAVEKSGGQTGFGATVDEMDDADRDKLNGIATAIEELPAAIAKAIKDEAEPAKGDEPEVTLADVAKSVGELTNKVEAQDAKITALGAGASAQGNGNGVEPVAKSTDAPHEGIL